MLIVRATRRQRHPVTLSPRKSLDDRSTRKRLAGSALRSERAPRLNSCFAHVNCQGHKATASPSHLVTTQITRRQVHSKKAGRQRAEIGKSASIKLMFCPC